MYRNLNEVQKKEVKRTIKEFPTIEGTDTHIELVDYVRVRDALRDYEYNIRIRHHQMDPDFGNNDEFIQLLNEVESKISVKILTELQELRRVESCRKNSEIKRLKKALEEIKNIDIVKTGRQVALDNIKKQMVLITLFDQDEKLIDNYEMMFGINLNNMTEEQINEIDLTVFTDCQPW